MEAIKQLTTKEVRRVSPKIKEKLAATGLKINKI